MVELTRMKKTPREEGLYTLHVDMVRYEDLIIAQPSYDPPVIQ
jgi:hypothetical protein